MAAEWRNDVDGALPSVAVAAHELKAPLGLLRQMSLLLEEGALNQHEARALQHEMTLTTERALRLVSDLAATANMTEELFPLEPVNPLALLNQMALDMRPMLQLYDRRVRWPRAGRTRPLVIANPTLLGRIMANFLDNAMKYSEAEAAIQVTVQTKGERVRLAVRDFGPMMSREEYRRLVAELETRKSVRTRPESSGLGVYVASRFARAMHGRIGLIRHRDGLTFYVEMPLSRQMSLL